MIKEAINFSLRGTKLLCNFDFEENLGSIEIDESQLKQAINNIIINSIQWMKTGGTINVKAQKFIIDDFTPFPLKPGEFVMLNIQDHGPGIPGNLINRVFDPYFTTNESRQGLGLSVTYSIIRNHDGYVTAESIYGKNTSIKIYLPISDKKPEKVLKPELKKITPDHMPHKLTEKRSIMIMDDEENIRKVTGQMLKFLGYNVFICI